MSGYGELPPLGFRAYWKLEDLNDASGNSKTLSVIGSASQVTGKFSGAYSVTNTSASNNHLRRTENISGSASRTYSLWCKLAATPGSSHLNQGLIMELYSGDKSRVAIRYSYNNTTPALSDVAIFRIGATSAQATNTTGALTVGVWYHVVGTWDSSTGNLETYVNGLKGTSGNSQGASANTTDNVTFVAAYGFPTAGGNNYSGGYCWNGAVDEVLIDSRVWSPADVRKYYAHTKGRFCPHTMV